MRRYWPCRWTAWHWRILGGAAGRYRVLWWPSMSWNGFTAGRLHSKPLTTSLSSGDNGTTTHNQTSFKAFLCGDPSQQSTHPLNPPSLGTPPTWVCLLVTLGGRILDCGRKVGVGCRHHLAHLLRLSDVRPEMMHTLAAISDFSYGWGLLDAYAPRLQAQVRFHA